MGHVRSTEVVWSALKDSAEGMPDAENAAKHGVAIKTIRRWRRLYVRQGLPRGQDHIQADCPRCDGVTLDESAYAALFGWYLGDGHLSVARRGVYSLHIFNDTAYPDLNNGISALMRLVKPQSRPHTRTKTGCVVTTVGWKHWPCLFPQHGPGRKHERQLVLADWQRDIVERHPADWQRDIVERHPAEFLRGLFHSDGCRFTNWATRTVGGHRRRYEYGRWMFSNESTDIMRWCQEALDRIGVQWTMPRRNCLSVATRAGVAYLDEVIGPKG